MREFFDFDEAMSWDELVQKKEGGITNIQIETSISKDQCTIQYIWQLLAFNHWHEIFLHLNFSLLYHNLFSIPP